MCAIIIAVRVGCLLRVVRFIMIRRDDLIDLTFGFFIIEIVNFAFGGTGVSEIALTIHAPSVTPCHGILLL